MKFYAHWRSYSTRYYGWLNAFLSGCAWMIFYPLALGKGFLFFEAFNKFFLSDIRLAGLFLGMIALFHLNGYYSTQKSTKLLEILESKLIFNFFNRKTLELNYLDISCLNYTQDIFKNFQFTLKNGEIKAVYASVKNKQQAFELIQQKIRESQT